MPIRIPNDLPATGVLQQENIFVMTEKRAVTQDIRPLEIVLLNLMPTKVVTETQLTRLLGNTPLQVHLFLRDRLDPCLLYSVNEPLSILHQALCLSDLVP